MEREARGMRFGVHAEQHIENLNSTLVSGFERANNGSQVLGQGGGGGQFMKAMGS